MRAIILSVITGLFLPALASKPAAAAPSGAMHRTEKPGQQTMAPVFDHLAVVLATDNSGSMGVSAREMANVQQALCARSLQRGDTLAHIEFAREARLVQLVHINDPAVDVSNTLRVLGDSGRGEGDTCLFAGAEKAITVARQLDTHTLVVLVFFSDGVDDLPAGMNRAEAERRLLKACAWWRLNPRSIRFVVTPHQAGPRARAGSARLARLLDAPRIALDSLAVPGLIDARITGIRRQLQVTSRQDGGAHPNPHARSQAQDAKEIPGAGGSKTWYIALAVFGLLAAGIQALLKHNRRQLKTGVPAEPEETPELPDLFSAVAAEAPEKPTWHGEVSVRVTIAGETATYNIHVPEDAPDGVVRFGAGAAVAIPGLAPALSLHLDESGHSLEVPAGVSLMLGDSHCSGTSVSVPAAFSFTLRSIFVDVRCTPALAEVPQETAFGRRGRR